MFSTGYIEDNHNDNSNNIEREKLLSIKDLNSDIAMDIYNVHNSFLFMNFHFQQYKDAGILQLFDLYSPYIIDDDMHSICNYFFAVSHIIHKIRIRQQRECTIKVTYYQYQKRG